mmetsp:Transcript_29931/g.81117  ORF Transcript_29931/g.81117 Transcript_29931/m.81117 type:complete len:218 (+) Transcript_29931:389-1042(+)
MPIADLEVATPIRGLPPHRGDLVRVDVYVKRVRVCTPDDDLVHLAGCERGQRGPGRHAIASGVGVRIGHGGAHAVPLHDPAAPVEVQAPSVAGRHRGGPQVGQVARAGQRHCRQVGQAPARGLRDAELHEVNVGGARAGGAGTPASAAHGRARPPLQSAATCTGGQHREARIRDARACDGSVCSRTRIEIDRCDVPRHCVQVDAVLGQQLDGAAGTS